MASVYLTFYVDQIPHHFFTNVIPCPPYGNSVKCGYFWPHFTYEETEAVRLSDLPKVTAVGTGEPAISRRPSGPRAQLRLPLGYRVHPSVHQASQQAVQP